MSKLDDILNDVSVEVAKLNYELSDFDKNALKEELKTLFSSIVSKNFDYEIDAEELSEYILIDIDKL